MPPALEVLLACVPAVVWSADQELRIVAIDASPGIGTGVRELPARPEVVEAARTAIQQGSAEVRCDFGEAVFAGKIVARRSADGSVEGVDGVLVRQSQAAAGGLFEQANDLVYTHNLGGQLTSVNPLFERISGYSKQELLGMELAQLLTPESADVFERQLEQLRGESEWAGTVELTLASRSGEKIHLESNARLLHRDGEPNEVLGIARNVTERKRLEEQLRQSQKMEAMGILAGGVAHDFNNLLTGILGYASLLASEGEPGGIVQEAAEVIQKASERAAELTEQLLNFARPAEQQRSPVDLHGCIQEIVDLFGRTVGKNITVIREFRAPAVTVMGDAGQMHQMFLNLALNARDAMPDGGVLRFRTEMAGDAASGRQFVRVSVIDTGSGIPPEARERIFEPFFTTKAKNHGTGLGLAMVYSIVKNHGGSIRVDSEVGRGTTFEIELPHTTRSAAAVAAARTEPAPAAGSGRILVVDGEEVVRLVAASMLEHLGYSVICVSSAREAIRYCRKHSRDIDLVILDLMLPDMPAKACLRALRQIHPDIRILLSSAAGHDAAVREALEMGVAQFMQKPYHQRALAERVASALAG
ncbi:MAG: ATP-binding protein [Bryobacteraceae bacterium]